MTSSIKTLIPYISAMCTEEQAPALFREGYVDLYVLTNKNEVFRHMKFSHGRELTYRVSADAIGISTAEESTYEEDFSTFFPGGPIPELFFDQILAFFQEVCTKFGSQLEAHCYIMWNDTIGYYVFVPKQEVSGASVVFSHADIPSQDAIIVDIHSHGSMGAFYSGTDDKDDENKTYISGVIGKVSTAPEYVFRLNVFKKKFKMTFEEIFSVPEKKAVNVPKDWLEKVTRNTPAISTFPKMPSVETPWGKIMGAGQQTYMPGPLSLTPTGRSSFWGGALGDELDDLDPVGLSPMERRIIQESTIEDVSANLLTEGNTDFVYAEYGAAAGAAYKTILESLSLLEENDEVLKTIWDQAFEMMSPKLQSKIMSEGL